MADRHCHICLGLGVVDENGYPILYQTIVCKQPCPRCGHTQGKPARYPGRVTDRGFIENPCWAIVYLRIGEPRLRRVRILDMGMRATVTEHDYTTRPIYDVPHRNLFNDRNAAELLLAELLLKGAQLD